MVNYAIPEHVRKYEVQIFSVDMTHHTLPFQYRITLMRYSTDGGLSIAKQSKGERNFMLGKKRETFSGRRKRISLWAESIHKKGKHFLPNAWVSGVSRVSTLLEICTSWLGAGGALRQLLGRVKCPGPVTSGQSLWSVVSGHPSTLFSYPIFVTSF